MSASADRPVASGPAAGERRAKVLPARTGQRWPVQILGPAGVAFLLASLAGLCGGLFLEFLLPADAAARWASPPALQALLAVQAGFLILFGPFMIGTSSASRERSTGILPASARGVWPLLGSAEHRQGAHAAFSGKFSADAPGPADCPLLLGGSWTLRFLLLLAICSPLYLAGAWFADATFQDVLRGLLYLAGLAVAAWGLGLWTRTGGLATAVVCLFVASAALAAPVALYILAELAEQPAGWLYLSSPTTCALAVAASRQGAWLPQPLWAWAIWPAVGSAMVFARLAVGSSPSTPAKG